MNLLSLLERLGERIGSRAHHVFRNVMMVVGVLAVITIGEFLPPLQALDTYLREHDGVRIGLIILTFVMTCAGASLLALAQFLPHPKPLKGRTVEEAEAKSPPMKYSSVRELARNPFGGSFGGEARFADVKEAWRNGSWRYDRRWRVLFVMALGAVLMLFGMFGLLIVITSAGLKFLMIILLVYAIARTVWALWRA